MIRGIDLEPRRIAILTPSSIEEEAVRGRWPRASYSTPERRNWDLDLDDPPGPSVDLVVASNTFLCSSDPAGWLRRVFRSSPLLLMQDLAVCRRGRGGLHTDPPTGDVMRYSITSHGIIGESDPGAGPYDLSVGPGRVLEAARYGTGCVKFVALLSRDEVA